MFNAFVVVLKSCNAFAGNKIESRCAVVILGIKIPLLVDVMSSMLDVSGDAPLALIEIFCAVAEKLNKKQSASSRLFFIR